MGRTDLATGTTIELKEEMEDFVKSYMKTLFEDMESKFDEKLKKQEAEKLEKQNEKMNIMNSELELLKRSIGIVEKEAKLEIQALTFEFKEVQAHKFASLAADVEALKSKLESESLRDLVQLKADFEKQKADIEAKMLTFENKSEKKLENIENSLEFLKNKTTSLATELSDFKGKIESVLDSTTTIKKELEELDNSSDIEEISLKLRALDFEMNSIKELNEIYSDDSLIKSNAPFKDLHKHFPTRICFYSIKFEGIVGKYKHLICSKIQKNYTKRVPDWQLKTVEKPFNILIGNRKFRITECHEFTLGGELSDTYYILPEIFEDIYVILGFEFLKKFAHKIKISKNELRLGKHNYELYEFK